MGVDRRGEQILSSLKEGRWLKLDTSKNEDKNVEFLTEIIYSNEQVKCRLNFHWEEVSSLMDFFKTALLTFQHILRLENADDFQLQDLRSVPTFLLFFLVFLGHSKFCLSCALFCGALHEILRKIIHWKSVFFPHFTLLGWKPDWVA